METCGYVHPAKGPCVAPAWHVTNHYYAAPPVAGSRQADHLALYAALHAAGHRVGQWQHDPDALASYAEAVGFDMYAVIEAYLFAHGWHAAAEEFGEPYVRAALLPAD